MKYMRKKILVVAIGAIFFFGLFFIDIFFRSSTPRPNIILMSIDTLRADHLSCYGYHRLTSPHIDQYSREFVMFEKAISQAPSTAPAHMSLFTGVTPFVHRVTNFKSDKKQYFRLDDNVITLTEILKKNGYLTVGFHGGGNISGVLGFDRGFDLYSEQSINWHHLPKSSSVLAPIGDWIKKSKTKDKPLFLFLHHYICHDPYLRAPKKFRLHFLKERVEGIPTGYKGVNLKKKFKNRRIAFWSGVDIKNEAHKNHVVSLYDGAVFFSDFIFKKVMKLLKKEKIYDNSLVILLSDHGEEFNEHGDTLHWRLFIETLHVPFLIKFPGSEFAGKRISEEIRTFDLMPTVLEYLNIKNENPSQAVSLLPLIKNHSEYEAPIFSFCNRLKYLRVETHHYIFFDQPSHGVSEWLFDKHKDPRELNNLVAIEREGYKRMKALNKMVRTKQISFRSKIGFGKEVSVKINQKLLEQLRALGYLN
jgi:arylsulfatase A-like enzyme